MGIKPLIIGTRGSDLALWQANTVAGLVPAPTELKIIKTSGDRFLDISLQGRLEKGFFTTEIEEQLLSGEIDVAVHSLKDLPTQITAGLALGAFLPRAAITDLLLIHPDWLDEGSLLPVRHGTRVGATSLRRQALLKLHAPYANADMLRGNVPTRIKRCQDGEYGAIVLARAGVERLGVDIGELKAYELDPWLWLPAPGQGAVTVQARVDDQDTMDLLGKIDDLATRNAVGVERQLLANFEGGCHTAFGAWAEPCPEGWNLKLGLDDEGWVQASLTGDLEGLSTLGPKSGIRFEKYLTSSREELCNPIQW